MANIDIAHEFFYSDFDSSRNYNNISYSENLFYSYYTVIGAVVKSKTGNNILLVSEDSMSSTTGKHIGNLISACPFSCLRVAYFVLILQLYHKSVQAFQLLLKKLFLPLVA